MNQRSAPNAPQRWAAKMPSIVYAPDWLIELNRKRQEWRDALVKREHERVAKERALGGESEEMQ